MRSPQRRAATVLALSLLVAVAPAQVSSNMDLYSHVPLPTGTCADVWSRDDLVFLARRLEGIEILDASDPTQPVSLFTGHQGLFVQDVKTDGDILYFSNESGNGQAVYVLDVTNPSSPVFLASYGSVNLLTCHNVTTYGTHLYCASLFSNSVVILDVSNPAQPVEVGSIQPQDPVSQIHDVAVVGDRLYSCWLSGGFEVHDLSGDPANPSLLVQHDPPTSFFHNAWPLGDGIHVATTQETAGGHLQVWDVSNPGAVVMASQWRVSPTAVMHNLMIADQFAFLTNYTEGVRVVDLLDPTQPVEVAWYDTFQGVNPFTFGAWGVYAGDRTRVYVADFSTGLYVLDLDHLVPSIAADQPSYSWGQTVTLTLGLDNGAPSDQLLQMLLSFSVAEVGPMTYPLLEFPLIMPASLNAQGPYPLALPAGPLPPLTLEFHLTASSPGGALHFATATTAVSVQ